MTDVVISSAAEAELADALFWYAQRSLCAANELDLAISRAIDEIAAVPDRYLAFDDRHRFYLLRSYPFIVIFRTDPNSIVVVAIAHTSRKPGYWQTR